MATWFSLPIVPPRTVEPSQPNQLNVDQPYSGINQGFSAVSAHRIRSVSANPLAASISAQWIVVLAKALAEHDEHHHERNRRLSGRRSRQLSPKDRHSKLAALRPDYNCPLDARLGSGRPRCNRGPRSPVGGFAAASAIGAGGSLCRSSGPISSSFPRRTTLELTVAARTSYNSRFGHLCR